MDERVVEGRLDVADTENVLSLLASADLRGTVVGDLLFLGFGSFDRLCFL